MAMRKGVSSPLYSERVKAVIEPKPLDTTLKDNNWHVDNGEAEKAVVRKEFDAVMAASGEAARVRAIDRFEYYDRVQDAYAVVVTRETKLYACVLLRKGVIFPD